MKKENQAIVITSIIAGVILIIALVALTMFSSILPSSKNTITVEGIANVEATPDLLTVYFNIETINDTAVEAKDENNDILEKLILELAMNGFTRDELKTQSFDVYPNYEWTNDKRIQKGYKATHSLKIELSSEDFDDASEVIDAGVNSGAGISYINFELSQELQNQYKAQALELASEDATIKAEAVVSGLNKNLGKLISVSVSDFGYYPWNVYTAEMDSAGSYNKESAELARQSVANITPSEQDITARVSATFKIK
jgi:uncharacterized protein